MKLATPTSHNTTTEDKTMKSSQKNTLCPACGTTGLSGCIDCFDAGRLGSGVTHADKVGHGPIDDLDRLLSSRRAARKNKPSSQRKRNKNEDSLENYEAAFPKAIS